MVVLHDLHKRFYAPEPVDAVQGVSLVGRAGEVVGLLGPNGAGKTTTLRMLVTLITPDRGTVTVDGIDAGQDPAAVRARLGFLSASTGLYGRLTAREMIHHFAVLQGVSEPKARTEALIERFDISGFADQRCDRLSTGQKQKTSIARALVHDPPVLILDEPTLGLDVLVAQTLLQFVEEARDQGRCVIYSTHIMSEAERLCDRLAIIHDGRVLAFGTLAELQERTGRHYLEDVFLALVTDARDQDGAGS
jgi:sodium transport system ATP-binding protein